jgi:hypothetical protein
MLAAVPPRRSARTAASGRTTRSLDDDNDDDNDEDNTISLRPPEALPAELEQVQPSATRTLRNTRRLNYANDGALLARTAADETDENSGVHGSATHPISARPTGTHPLRCGPPLALRLAENHVTVIANHQHTSAASAVVAHAATSGLLGTMAEALGWGPLANPSSDPTDARRQSPYAPLEGSRTDVDTFGHEFDQINPQQLLGIDGWSFQQMGDIPVALREPFAHAVVDVLSALEETISSGNLVGRDRALKALALLPTLLLRLPPPGSDRTTAHGAIVHRRIGIWAHGDIGTLVQDLTDVAHINSSFAAAATARTG